jgi:hypothetical protein
VVYALDGFEKELFIDDLLLPMKRSHVLLETLSDKGHEHVPESRPSPRTSARKLSSKSFRDVFWKCIVPVDAKNSVKRIELGLWP